jgi:hypothetical protein
MEPGDNIFLLHMVMTVARLAGITPHDMHNGLNDSKNNEKYRSDVLRYAQNNLSEDQIVELLKKKQENK